MIRTLTTLTLLLTTSPFAAASTQSVPGEFATIQAAIDASSDGDTVSIGKGVYVETISVDDKPGLTLAAKNGQKVVIDGNGGGDILTVDANSPSVTIKGLRLRNSAANGMTLNGDAPRVIACRVQDVTGFGILCEGDTARIESCHVAGAGLNGVALTSLTSAVVRKCSVQDAGSSGITLSSCVAVRVDDCTVTGAGYAGISLSASHAITISDNAVSDAQVAGIYVGQTSVSSNVVVEENFVNGGSGDGVHVANVSGAKLIGNVVKNAGWNGIHVDQVATDVTVTKNKSMHSSSHGFRISADTVLVRGNSSKHAGTAGFSVVGDSCALLGNVATNSATHGFRVTGDATGLIENKAKKSGGVDFDGSTTANHLLDNSFETFSP